MKKIKLPSVVFVGRTNVGKSTLFNRLSVNVKSIVYDQAGVTRDILQDTISWQGKQFDIIDTGGISFVKTTDIITEKSRKQALDILEKASIIVFVVDAKDGVVDEDLKLSKMIHGLGKPVILLVNKVDVSGAADYVYEFNRFGFSHMLPISAVHGNGIGDLLDTIVTLLPDATYVEQAESLCNVVFIGKPNVGKSSLLNALARKDRMIVSDIPGTTREPISEHITFNQEDIVVTDTAGIRRKGSVRESLEQLMVKTSFKALERAQIVVLLIDASSGDIVDQELKLAFYAFQEKDKAVLVLFNKEDILQPYERERLMSRIDEYKYFFDKIPYFFISCVSGKNIGRIMNYITALWQRHTQTLSGEDITMLFKDALARKPLYRNQQELHVYRAEQVGTGPITLILFVNEPKWFGPSQLTYFENILRKKFDLRGVPIKILTRKRKK